MRRWFAMVACLVVLATLVAGCSVPGATTKGSDEPVKELAYNEYTDDMKLSAVTYSQTVVENYVPGAKFPWDMAEYNVVRTNDRYKIEGTANGVRYWCIIEWDYKTDETFTATYLKVGDQVYIDR